MAIKPVHVIAALGAAFALLAYRRADAYAQHEPFDPSDPGFMGPIFEADTVETPFDEALSDPNVRAFLYMIRALDAGTPGPAGYVRFYGGSTFTSWADHPVLTGEKRGVALPAAMCRAAGFADGICVSTAAGGYQFTVPTWNDVRGIRPRLPDFSPESQDVAAVRLLRKIGALQPIREGNLEAALRRASTRWASLPYSTAQQNPKPLAYALEKFTEGLTALA